jgi:hypothetical protein
MEGMGLRGEPRPHLIMEGRPVHRIPSQCELRATVVGPGDKTLFTEAFGGGWRMEVLSGKRSGHTEAGEGLIELQSRPFINGRFIYRQYYRVVRDRLVLIRLEDDQGRSAANSYFYPNHTTGPKIPIRDPIEWENSLASSDPGEVLWALVWLGGAHASPTAVSQNISRENLEETEHFHAVWKRPAIQQKILRLKSSPNPWIAEAAGMALLPGKAE